MNPNSHEEPTEQELNAMGIYKGNPDWANKFNVTRRIAQLLKESQTPLPLQSASMTCVPEREENLSGQLERHRDTLQEKPKLVTCLASIERTKQIQGTFPRTETYYVKGQGYTKESVDNILRYLVEEIKKNKDDFNKVYVGNPSFFELQQASAILLRDNKRIVNYVEERLK